MKHLLVSFALAPSLVCAAGWTDIKGRNALGEEIIFRHVSNVTVQQLPNDSGYAQHVVANVIVKTKSGEKTYENLHCLHSYGKDETMWLQCSPVIESPLAGVTLRRSAPKTEETPKWLCVTGCGKRVPISMLELRWE